MRSCVIMTMTSERTYGGRGHAGRLAFRCAGSWRCGQVVSQELQHLQLRFICCLATWLQGCRQPPHVPVFHTVRGGHMGSQAEREGKLDLRTHKIGSNWCIRHGATVTGNNLSSVSRVCVNTIGAPPLLWRELLGLYTIALKTPPPRWMLLSLKM